MIFKLSFGTILHNCSIINKTVRLSVSFLMLYMKCKPFITAQRDIYGSFSQNVDFKLRRDHQKDEKKIL